MILFPATLILLFAALVLQQFIPPLAFLHGARVLLLPVVLAYGSVALPLPAALALAFAAGVMWDATTVYATATQVEISLGWSTLLYGALATLMNGLRPLFLRGRWEVLPIAAGLSAGLSVLAEYLLITVRRGGFDFPPEVAWRCGGSALVAAAVAPFLFLALKPLAGAAAPGRRQRPSSAR